LLVACGDDGGAGGSGGSGSPGGSNTPSGATCPPASTLTHGNFGQQFFSTYCLRCHTKSLIGTQRSGAPVGFNYDSAVEIRALAAKIDGQAAWGPTRTNTSMPPNGDKPTPEERMQLGEWLACGAP
jgi:uncharacterized membrane protein